MNKMYNMGIASVALSLQDRENMEGMLDCTKLDLKKIVMYHLHRAFSMNQQTFLYRQHIYKRLKMSSTTSVVVAFPPKSGLSSLPSSRLPSTAA